jgi:hypothetical protein
MPAFNKAVARLSRPSDGPIECTIAALGAYDKNWSSVIASDGVSAVGETLMKSMMPAMAAATFKSESGILAYKLMANDLMFYSPGLVGDLNQILADQEKQKQAVPKF